MAPYLIGVFKDLMHGQWIGCCMHAQCDWLLNVSDVTQCLGCFSLSGVSQPPEMKHHAFFASFDWAKLFNKVMDCSLWMPHANFLLDSSFLSRLDNAPCVLILVAPEGSSLRADWLYALLYL